MCTYTDSSRFTPKGQTNSRWMDGRLRRANGEKLAALELLLGVELGAD
eukprot:SAG31_NODE_40730_length_279_cov_0.855556_2_plen_47_part_01